MSTTPAASPRLRVGVSACLRGERVRYDGTHERHEAVVERLAPHVEWVPVCPEVELGSSVPRPPIRLERDGETIRLARFDDDRTDLMERMSVYAAERVAALRRAHLCGYVVKSRSPSCGVGDAPLHDVHGERIGERDGVFVAALRVAMPELPIVSERALEDPAACAAFLEHCAAYRELLRRSVAEGWPEVSEAYAE